MLKRSRWHAEIRLSTSYLLICFWPANKKTLPYFDSMVPCSREAGDMLKLGSLRPIFWFVLDLPIKKLRLISTLWFHAQEKQVTCWNSALYVLSSDLFLTCRSKSSALFRLYGSMLKRSRWHAETRLSTSYLLICSWPADKKTPPYFDSIISCSREAGDMLKLGCLRSVF